MRPLGDRRARIRFEVVGTLRGTFETIDSARLVNISGTGVLLETSAPMPVGSIQVIQLTLDGHPTRVTARVRHLSRMGHHPEQTKYLIGLEFLAPPPAIAESVSHLMVDGQLE